MWKNYLIGYLDEGISVIQKLLQLSLEIRSIDWYGAGRSQAATTVFSLMEPSAAKMRMTSQAAQEPSTSPPCVIAMGFDGAVHALLRIWT